MYIRRKIYSEIEDELVPVNEVINDDYSENLYSVTMTEEELSLFSDLCEALYSDDEEKKGLSTGAKIGIGAGAGTAALAGGIYGAEKLGKKIAEDAWNKRMQMSLEKKTATKKGQKAYEALSRKQKVGESLQAPMKYIRKGYEATVDAGKKGAEKVSEGAKKVGSAVKGFWNGENGIAGSIKNAAEKSEAAGKELLDQAIKAAKENARLVGKKKGLKGVELTNFIKKAGSKAEKSVTEDIAKSAKIAKFVGKHGKAINRGVAGAAAVGLAGGGLAAYKHFKNKD